MKKNVYFLIMLLFFIKGSVSAQTATATWSLATDATAVATGGLTATNQTIGSALAGTQYNSTFGGVAAWQRLATTANFQLPLAYDPNAYVEYSVKVPTGKKLNLTSISFNALGGGTGGARMAVYYSLNGFLASSSAGTISYNNQTYNNDTGAGSVALLNTSTPTLTGQQIANIANNIEVTQGKTLSIRIYLWAGSAAKYFASKNFVLTGALSDDTAPVLPKYELTTSLSDNNAGTITRTPNGTTYDEGEEISLNAVPNFGYKFIKWVDVENADADLSTTNPYIVTMDAAKNIKAVFEALTTYNFTLNKTGSNWGVVQLNPEPTNGRYVAGTEVVMTVIPNNVSTFSYWENNNTALQRTVTVNSDVTYTATFDEIPFIVGWDFKDQNIRQGKTGDFYSESTNTGLISIYKPDNTPVNWLSSPSSFSPAYPAFRFWTLGADFLTERRYVKAQFSTAGYKSIKIKSMVSGNYQTYAVQKLQYSLDDITYTDLATVDITSAYNSTWKDLNADLPVDAEGQTRVYLKWIADTSSPILGNSTDNDGTAFTNIFVFAEKVIVNDSDIPVLISTVPAASSTTATTNGSVVLTFNEKVKLGTGNITLNGQAITGVFGSKTATFAYEKLNYNTEYTLIVLSGALTDMSDNAFAGTTVTFRTGVRTEPTKKLFDAVVAKDGSGDYVSITAAIAAAPAGRNTPWIIFIKNGKYTGHHDIPSTKPFIHLIGQSRDGVIISDNLLSGDYNGVPGLHVSLGATMVVNSTDCYFENITLENSHGYELQIGPQALALYTTKDKFTMNNCYLRSYQDTYLTSYSNITDRHYIKNSRIEGAVDFIYGGGDVFFDKDTLTMTRKTGGYIVAPSHGAGTAWGYVFSSCVVDESKTTGATTYFGRPWQNAPKTVFLNTKLHTGIYATGWYYKMGAIPAVFADYGTIDANGNPVDVSQRISNYEYDVKDGNGNVINTITGTAKSSLTDLEAAAYTYENVILRSGDTWDPRMMTEAPDKPGNVKVNGANITWDHTPYARLYIVIRDHKVIHFTINNQYTDPNPTGGANHVYEIQAASEFGALSLSATAVDILPITGLSLKATKVNQSVQLNWNTLSEKGTSHFVVERTVDGKIFEALGQRDAAGESNLKQEYYFTDHTPFTGTNFYRIKAIDFDGHTDYSELVTVNFAEIITITVYPNPVSQTLNVLHPLSFPDAVLTVVDLSGKKLISKGITSAQLQTALDVSSLSSGVYFLQFINKNEVTTSKFIKR